MPDQKYATIRRNDIISVTENLNKKISTDAT